MSIVDGFWDNVIRDASAFMKDLLIYVFGKFLNSLYLYVMLCNEVKCLVKDIKVVLYVVLPPKGCPKF